MRASSWTRSAWLLRRELDFELEGRGRGARRRGARRRPRVLVPRVHWEATARNVPDARLRAARAPRRSRAALAQRGARAGGVPRDRRRRLRPPGLRQRPVSTPTRTSGTSTWSTPRARRASCSSTSAWPSGSPRGSRGAPAQAPGAAEARRRRPARRAPRGCGAVIPGREAGPATPPSRRALAASCAGRLGANSAGIQALKELGKRRRCARAAPSASRASSCSGRARSPTVYNLAERIAPDVDPMRLFLPHLLRFVTASPAPGFA